MQNGWEIQGEAELAADSWAGYILTPKQGEGETQSPANCVHAPNQALQLASAEPIVVRNTAIHLTPKSQPRIEVVQEGKPTSVNMTACGLNSDNARAGVASE